MSGVGLSELVLLFVIGLLILGPERLPRVASQIGRWVGRARRTANQLRYQLEREISLAEFEKSAADRHKKEASQASPAATEKAGGASATGSAATAASEPQDSQAADSSTADIPSTDGPSTDGAPTPAAPAPGEDRKQA